MKLGFHTFGCKLNQYETEALASAFRAEGFTVVSGNDDADAYVVNTCTVTSRADHKARALIRGLARSHPRSMLYVTGCSAQVEAESLAALAENVLVIPQAEKARLLDLPRLLAGANDAHAALRPGSPPAGWRDPFSFTMEGRSFRTRAFLKVQDGCDSRCSYCRVPQARGPSVSLDPEEAVRRAARLEAQGHREIVITGVNICAYQVGHVDLAGLVRGILAATRGVRLRLSSLEPESLSDDLAAAIAHPRICPHFHLSVQSGADAVLGRMRRRYRADTIDSCVSLLRAAKADPFIAADIIVGFPGETVEDFEATRQLVARLAFAALHVFPFSSRPGTAAAAFRPVVPEGIRSQRARVLGLLSRQLSEAYARSWIGREVDVLLERGAARAHGVSGNYLKVDVAGLPSGDVSGHMVRTRITSAGRVCAAQFLDFIH